jgi:hypothetical protein
MWDKMPLFGYQWFQVTGALMVFFFLASAITSPAFRQQGLLKYHIKIGKFTILFGFIHMFFALSALLFQWFP